jgi:hypothetical protein
VVDSGIVGAGSMRKSTMASIVLTAIGICAIVLIEMNLMWLGIVVIAIDMGMWWLWTDRPKMD